MIKPFRFRICRGFISCVKAAECGECDTIHITVHCLFIIDKERLDKIVVGHFCSASKPPLYHFSEHFSYFKVCKWKRILDIAFCYGVCRASAFDVFEIYYFQIPRCQEQAPDCSCVIFKLAEHYLFVQYCLETITLYKLLHCLFNVWIPFLYQWIYKAVPTGVRPIGAVFAVFLNKGCNWPRIINVRISAKRKPVIPFLDILLFAAKPCFVKCPKHFILHKAKACGIFLGSRRYHIKVIQVRKNTFLRNPCNACDDAAVYVTVGLEGSVKKSPEKFNSFIPVTRKPCLLHRGIIFIQQDDYILIVIALQKTDQGIDCPSSYFATHPGEDRFKVFLLVRT